MQKTPQNTDMKHLHQLRYVRMPMLLVLLFVAVLVLRVSIIEPWGRQHIHANSPSADDHAKQYPVDTNQSLVQTE